MIDLIAEGKRVAQDADAEVGNSPELRYDEPLTPCADCGSGVYYQLQRGGHWYCAGCSPPGAHAAVMVAVSGGRVPDGATQDVDAVIREAVEGLEVSAAQVREAMSADDIADIRRGVITGATVRAFARHLLESVR